jgi:hypothetical protein
VFDEGVKVPLATEEVDCPVKVVHDVETVAVEDLPTGRFDTTGE